MPVVPTGYLPRIVDDEVDECLETYGAVEITGAKWCGKTWTARKHAKSIIYLDEGQNLSMAQSDPKAALVGDTPHVIDEWQLVPSLWNVVRHEVDDAGGKKGLWILTGSSTPAKDKVHHSGVGRIGRVRMLPMSLQESGDSTGEVSLSSFFDGEFAYASCEMDVDRLVALCCRGGWPEAVGVKPSRALRIARDYVDATTEQSVAAKGGNPDVARRLLGSLARNLGQATTRKTMIRDMYGEVEGDDVVSPATISNYLALLESLYLLLPIKGWEPPAKSPKRFRTSPKRYLVDPSLAVSLLQMNERSLKEDWQTLGLVFENLCMRDLSVYARALPEATQEPVHYYRDDNGLEADAIVEDAAGRWGAFEVKLGENKADDAAANLLRMRDKLMRNARARTREPEFLAVLVGLGERSYRRSDGVYVIPIGCLGR
jgi:predicted AAA+ superfamily ATPase